MKKVFLDKNGKVNRKTVTSLILLLIVLVQQLCAIFGIKFTGDPSRIMDLVNTILTIGGILGLVDGVTVDTETVKSISKAANEALELASQHKREEGNDEKSK